MVAAQPTSSTPRPPQGAGAQRVAPTGTGVPSAPQAPVAQTAPTAPAPVSEEAPPANVPTPQPAVVPPITDKDVAPAPEVEQKAAAPKAPAGPQRRPRYDVAVLQVLDKVTAETLRFEAAVGKPVRYKTLIFTVKACEHTAADEPVEDSIAYLEILSQPRAEPGRPVLPAKQAFKGWMYASSPSLDPLEHPVYDAWLITCRTAAPVASAPPAPAR
ncbi:DUF2155 domain-containing protein [Phenylobacterium soli]|uniref:DUF2155 domain-containing protein n=2 Tax=Phenylobacterium soli TaxID=2170551 RepID=A0A328AP50_9CAUL|nr:DUF2155 domain-containing protein [Phenylobacterium soli]